MFCISCGNATTGVTNSRPHKKEPRVWRRRHCTQCGIDFTTQEKPLLNATVHVLHEESGAKEPFYQGKLILSIMRSFAHDESYGIINAPALSETTIAALLPMGNIVSARTIASTCHVTLLRFDKTAAAQYALAHSIARTPKRRRKSA